MNGIQTIIAEIDRQINQLPRDHGSELALKALSELRSIADAQRDPDETTVSRFSLYWYADDPGKIYLSNLFVPLNNRGSGEGRKALLAAIRAAALLGADWLYLRPASNFAAAWYSRHGFCFFDNDLSWMRREIFFNFDRPKSPEECEAELAAPGWGETDDKMILFFAADYAGMIGDWPNCKVVESRAAFARWLNYLPGRFSLLEQKGADPTVSAEIVKEFRDKIKSCRDYAARGAKVNSSGVNLGKIDLCDSLLEDIKEIAAKYGVKIEEGEL